MLNIEEMTDENRFIKKMLYSYRMIMQKLKLNNLIKNRQNFSEKAYEGALQRGFKILDRLGGEFPDLCCNAILMKYKKQEHLIVAYSNDEYELPVRTYMSCQELADELDLTLNRVYQILHYGTVYKKTNCKYMRVRLDK